MDNKVLDELQNRVREVLANSPAKDVEQNLRALMSGFFSRLNLVTREEFEVQQQVLARAREKLRDLERRVAAVEEKVWESTGRDGGA